MEKDTIQDEGVSKEECALNQAPQAGSGHGGRLTLWCLLCVCVFQINHGPTHSGIYHL